MGSPVLPSIFLTLLGGALASAVFFYGGVVAETWNITLLAIAILALAYWTLSRKKWLAPALEPWLRWPLLLLSCYAALQLVPLPVAMLRKLSPARAQLVDLLQPVLPGVISAPISVTPPAGLANLFRLLACVLVFLLVRELMWRFAGRLWAVVIPLLCIGVFEAGLGMIQCSADWGNTMAKGTYVDRDHFAGLLEMILPFAFMYGVAILRRTQSRFSTPAVPSMIACGLFAIGALLLVAIVYSLSRMGFLVALSSLFAMTVMTAGPALPTRRFRWLSLAAIAAAAGLLFVFLPPDQLIKRFAEMASTEKVSAEMRLRFWRESLPLIAAYPVFGTGLGGYESAFRKFQISEPLLSVDFAHNDYLQFLAELGAIGFALLAVFLGGILWKTSKAVLEQSTIDSRYMAIACAGSLLAILLHSVVDFNLHIPANALALAWICGIAAGLRFTASA